MTMLMGSQCSDVSKHIAQIVPYWNLVMVSYGSTSVTLTDRENYPTFFRTVAPDSSHNAAKAAFLDHFGWHEVSSLMQDEELFSLALSEFTRYLQSYSNITILTSLNIEDDLPSKMQQLQDLDARVIIGNFQESTARAVFCQAYKSEMYGSKYVWLLPGWFQREWWRAEDDTDCTADELAKTVAGYFAIDSLDINIDNRSSISGLTSNAFELEMLRRGVSTAGSYAPHSYDAVWTIALTIKSAMDHLNRTEGANGNSSWMHVGHRGSGFTYDNQPMRDLYTEIVSDLRFTGVSGPVRFKGPDRYGVTTFRQNQGGEMKLVGLYFPEEAKLVFEGKDLTPVFWEGGLLPVDKLRVYDQRLRINYVAYITTTALSACGLILAGVFLFFNINYRKTKFIKLSSPNLNNITIVGCIMVYVAVIMLGLESERVGLQVFTPLCTIRAAFLMIGFSFAFGSMFVKTYRVYHIITHATSRVIKRKMLHESTLFLMIGMLLLIDVIILTVWSILDPMIRVEERLPKESSNDTVAFVPIVEVCRSKNLSIWLGLVYAYKGLLLLFGLFLAWETRKVKIPALNDSHYIAVCVYNVTIMSILAVVVSNLVTRGDQLTTSFVLVTVCICITTTMTLCFLFVPKVYTIHAVHLGADPVTKSVGLEIKGRTRRFVTDETTEMKESIYRAEVQMRAFRKEKNKLDQRIADLEARLRMVSKPDYADSSSGDEVEWMGDLCQEKDMYMLLHLPETSIQDTGPSERPYQNHVKTFEHEAELHCLLQRDDSGRHSLDSRSVSNYTTELPENHCSNVGDDPDSNTPSPSRSAKQQHAELCLQNSNKYQYHLQENPVVARSMRKHPPLIKSLSSGSVPRRHTLVSSIDGPNRCIKNDAICRYSSPARTVGGGPARRSHSNSERRESARFHNEVRRLVVEMRSVQMRLLQLNEKPEMIYYV
ncbi:gamma-aminobutyric acid type B receptor subunit 2-like [Asterias rubens]|uniref:gamma-aminobutyric acid type B receptor subunit 2-like n=1 Tax=Asterias rubens TaxID=7604 RepID=UPI001455B5B5|nr:gamma-aminobutyric acid type B receptor subunit 2-like [Asterias rubens]